LRSRRNNLMQEAQAQAQRGGEILASALAQVPPPARERYPGLCQGLGDVYIPTLEQMGLGSAMMEVFGGDLMDAMAGARGPNTRSAHHSLPVRPLIVSWRRLPVRPRHHIN